MDLDDTLETVNHTPHGGLRVLGMILIVIAIGIVVNSSSSEAEPVPDTVLIECTPAWDYTENVKLELRSF